MANKKPKTERKVIKEKRLLKLVGMLMVRYMSKYFRKMDTNTFKKYAKEVHITFLAAFACHIFSCFIANLHCC